jgi:nucleotide-binding universal stress UspA family protein
MTCHDLYPADAGSAPTGAASDRRVLVGVDGSPSSVTALAWAARHARASGACLEAVLVFAPAPAMFFAVGGYPAVNPVDAIAVRRRARALLERTVEEAVGGSADVRLLVVADPSPAKALTRLARGADMLVVGARRHSALGLVLGSTAAACMRQAECPLVVVPTGVGESLSAPLLHESTSGSAGRG